MQTVDTIGRISVGFSLASGMRMTMPGPWPTSSSSSSSSNNNNNNIQNYGMSHHHHIPGHLPIHPAQQFIGYNYYPNCDRRMAYQGQGRINLKTLLENPNLLHSTTEAVPSQEHRKDVTKNVAVDKKETKNGEATQPPGGFGNAFLGASLWGRNELLFTRDLDLEILDLDEFLNENATTSHRGEAVENTRGSSSSCSTSSGSSSCSTKSKSESSAESDDGKKQYEPPPPKAPKVEFNVSPQDLALAAGTLEEGAGNFNPKTRKFSTDELRPQPVIRKSKKMFIPEDLKDDKYWCRRKKNNQAAKRSREAKRLKENQISLRAAYLEKENDALKDHVQELVDDNKKLQQRLDHYIALYG